MNNYGRTAAAALAATVVLGTAGFAIASTGQNADQSKTAKPDVTTSEVVAPRLAPVEPSEHAKKNLAKRHHGQSHHALSTAAVAVPQPVAATTRIRQDSSDDGPNLDANDDEGTNDDQGDNNDQGDDSQGDNSDQGDDSQGDNSDDSNDN